MSEKPADEPEREDVFNMPESGTYDPKTGRYRGHRIKVNKTTCEIVSTGRRKMPPNWIPEGWASLGDNRWVPDWSDCMYRKVDVMLLRGKPPAFKILCTKYNNLGEEIPITTCQDCKVFKSAPHKPDLPKGMGFDELVAREWEVTSDDGTVMHLMRDHPLFGVDSEVVDGLEHQVFLEEMKDIPPRLNSPQPEELPLNDPRHMRNRRAIQLKWVPCIHRIEKEVDVSESDCTGCSSGKGAFCNNPKASAFKTRLRRQICIDCPVAESLEQSRNRKVN